MKLLFLSADTVNSLPADVYLISETALIASAEFNLCEEVLFYIADDVLIITEHLKITSEYLNYFLANVVYHFLIQIKRYSPKPNS